MANIYTLRLNYVAFAVEQRRARFFSEHGMHTSVAEKLWITADPEDQFNSWMFSQKKLSRMFALRFFLHEGNNCSCQNQGKVQFLVVCTRCFFADFYSPNGNVLKCSKNSEWFINMPIISLVEFPGIGIKAKLTLLERGPKERARTLSFT